MSVAESPLGIVGGAILSSLLPPVDEVGIGTVAFTTDQGIMTAEGGGWVTGTGGGGGGGGQLFNQSCAYTLASGTVHNLGPGATSGVFVAGTTNRLILTPNASGTTIDSITSPGTDGFVILLYNPHLTRSLVLLDQNNAGTGGTAGNLLACPNPNALAANAIEVILPPQSAQKLTYYSNVWVFA
jgi:hypothetical protein